jgi:hypothetical protein
MRVNKNYWLAACGTLAVAGGVMLFSAHRIEAQYSTPVKVLNTSAGPVLNSHVDDPGRIPYMERLIMNNCGLTECEYSFQPVPAGHRVVIQQVSGVLNFTSPSGLFGLFVGVSSTANTNELTFQVPVAGAGANGQIAFTQPILYYVDAGQSPVLVILSNVSAQSGATLNLVGYELDCNAAPCAAIANR